MIRYFLILFILIFFIPYISSGQEQGTGLNFQMTMMNNPALTGSEGDGQIRLSYINNFPGNNYNLHFIAMSYDGYFPSLHGGAGFYLTDNYLGGIINDLTGGFSYSYFFQAGKKLYLSGGLSGAFYHRGFSFGSAVLPDQIDVLGGVVYPSGEVLSSKGRTTFDLAAGLLIMTDKSFAGISISHLAEPQLSGTDIINTILGRKLLIHGATTMYIGQGKSLVLTPLAKLELARDLVSAGAGAEFGNQYLTVGGVFLADNSKNIDIQTGISITWVGTSFFYDYRFNIVSGNNLMPFTVLHHAGIVFSVNHVDKRKTVNTINFPKL